MHKAVLADHVAKEWVMKHREAYKKEQEEESFLGGVGEVMSPVSDVGAAAGDVGSRLSKCMGDVGESMSNVFLWSCPRSSGWIFRK